MYYIPTNKDGTADPLIQRDFSGRSFYVSINLRRYDTSVSQDDIPVLKIKVPYVYWDTTALGVTSKFTRYAVFDSVPSNTVNDYHTLNNNYGKIWELQPRHNPKPNEVIITRKMLPLNNEDITISGYLNFGGIVGGGEDSTNHVLKRASSLHNGKESFRFIDSLKLEVTYLDTLPIAIDWVKFETPNARKINSGFYDDDIAASVQNDLDNFTNNADYVSRNIKPSRWIVNIEGNPVNWEAERHFRKIVGNVTTGATGGHLSTQWDEYLGTVDKWMEVNDITSYVASPFCASSFTNKTETSITHNSVTKTNSNYWKTFGIHQGYTKNDYPSGGALDRFNSGYEIFMKSPVATKKFYKSNYFLLKRFSIFLVY